VVAIGWLQRSYRTWKSIVILFRGACLSLLLGCRVGIGAPYIACLSSRLFPVWIDIVVVPSARARWFRLASGIGRGWLLWVWGACLWRLLVGGCWGRAWVACVPVGWLSSLLGWASRLLGRNLGDLGDMLGRWL
jgi:hypothetical protein